MFGFRIFGRKPRQFEYKPRFYDPEKEAREERKKELLGEEPDAADDRYVPGQYIKKNMMSRRGLGAGTAKSKKRLSVPMAIAILAALLLLVYWVLQ